MAVADTKVPSDLAREFEALGIPIVTHRLTRFKDGRLREAAHLWLAQRQAELAAAHEAAARQRAGQRYRRFLAVTAAIGVAGWAFAIIVMLR